MMRKQIVTGTVFDIRRFSTHDGEGIRTTVFLKGCPLACVWCHNPEGISTAVRPLFFPNKCIGCGSCIRLSRDGGVRSGIGGGIMLAVEKAEDWGRIIAECPSAAIVWDSKQMPVPEVVELVCRDKPFYRYGGGVTLSGGEPLLQDEFALKLLKALKTEGIHTAIETALHVPAPVLEAVLPYLDLIYADFKLFNPVRHRQYAGADNRLIKQNIYRLLTSEKKTQVIIRTPLIPGITADRENIEQISRFISGIYKEVTYELLNYNPLAQAKYHLLDQPYYFKDNPDRYSRPEMERFAEYAGNGGVNRVIIEQ